MLNTLISFTAVEVCLPLYLHKTFTPTRTTAGVSPLVQVRRSPHIDLPGSTVGATPLVYSTSDAIVESPYPCARSLTYVTQNIANALIGD